MLLRAQQCVKTPLQAANRQSSNAKRKVRMKFLLAETNSMTDSDMGLIL
jgi:hypothetical protein